MEKIRSVVDAFMKIDLVGLVLRALLPDWLVKRLPVPHITIDQLVSFLLGLGEAWVKGALDVFFDGALRLINTIDHLPWVDVSNFYWRVDALAKAFDIVLTPTPPPPPDVMPTTPLAGFPDVYDAFFGGGRDGALVASIDALGVEVRGGLRSALAGSATMFADLGTTFAAEADRAASMGSVAPHARARRRRCRPVRARVRARGRPPAGRRGVTAAGPARDRVRAGRDVGRVRARRRRDPRIRRRDAALLGRRGDRPSLVRPRLTSWPATGGSAASACRA